MLLSVILHKRLNCLILSVVGEWLCAVCLKYSGMCGESEVFTLHLVYVGFFLKNAQPSSIFGTVRMKTNLVDLKSWRRKSRWGFLTRKIIDRGMLLNFEERIEKTFTENCITLHISKSEIYNVAFRHQYKDKYRGLEHAQCLGNCKSPLKFKFLNFTPTAFMSKKPPKHYTFISAEDISVSAQCK